MTPHDIVVSRWGARFQGRAFPCSVGRAGITRAKTEGDMATPAGVHRLTGILFRADRLAADTLPNRAQALGPADLWSDDARDPAYNTRVRAPHPFGHERLCRADPQYDLILPTDWNWPQAVPGCGSAIFVHIWRGPGLPTAGCVAFGRADLIGITRRLTPRTRLIIRGG